MIYAECIQFIFILHYFVGLCCLFVTGTGNKIKVQFSSMKNMRNVQYLASDIVQRQEDKYALQQE